MHIHILGICGTFMAGLASLAKSQGLTVTGCDQNVYPPMSTQLEAQDIKIIEGFDPSQTALNSVLAGSGIPTAAVAAPLASAAPVAATTAGAGALGAGGSAALAALGPIGFTLAGLYLGRKLFRG